MANAQGTRTVYHYTDRKGKEGIERTRTIETGGSGGKQGKIKQFLASLLIIIYVRRRLSGCFCSCFGVCLFMLFLLLSSSSLLLLLSLLLFVLFFSLLLIHFTVKLIDLPAY